MNKMKGAGDSWAHKRSHPDHPNEIGIGLGRSGETSGGTVPLNRFYHAEGLLAFSCKAWAQATQLQLKSKPPAWWRKCEMNSFSGCPHCPGRFSIWRPALLEPKDQEAPTATSMSEWSNFARSTWTKTLARLISFPILDQPEYHMMDYLCIH